MSERLERMLTRSKSCYLKAKDGVNISTNSIYHTTPIIKKDIKPQGEFDIFLLESLGQDLFNQYAYNEIDKDLSDKINILKFKFYDIGRKYNPQRVKFIS